MNLRRLIYLSRIELPNPRSHSIQMMRTCHAIAQTGVGVDFFVRAEEPVDREPVFDYYGLEPLDNFTLRTLRPREWEHAAFVRKIVAIARRCGHGTALYTRDYHIARRLIRLRPFLRLPVFVETHMLDGFFDREYVPQWVAEVSAGREPDPRSTQWFSLVDSCYRRADGVVSLLGSTYRILRQRYESTPVIAAWHGTDPDPQPAYEPEGRRGVYYIGNLYDYYQPETLVEAMRHVPGHELMIVGGNDPHDVARTRRATEQAGVADRVRFLGHVAPTRVREFYRRCRVVVTLFAGQKVAEYLSRGLPVVAPDLPIIPEILRDGETCALFAPGSSRSLAEALRRVLEEPQEARRLARGAYQESLRHTWPQRARQITEFVSGCMASAGGRPKVAVRPRAGRQEPPRLRRLIYVSRIALPNNHAHSIQMMRTCHAIASQGVEVDFYVRGTAPPSVQEVLDHYGLEPLEGFRIHWLAPRRWEGAGFLYSALRQVRAGGSGTAIYTRDYHLARRFIRLRPLMRMPVVVETHKRDAYYEMGYKLDGDGATGRAALDPERRSDRHQLIDYAYRHADGIVAAWADTYRLIAERYPATPVQRIWFDTVPLPRLTYDPAERHGIYYVGNLYPRYRPSVLVEALSRIEDEKLYIVGGNEPEHVAQVRRLAAQRGVADRIHLEGYVLPGRIQSLFDQFRVAVALLPGLKIAEYFSHGLPIVAPDIPVARDLLRDGETCLLFEPGDADSLASAIRRILEDPALARRLATGALQEARRHARPDRARRIIRFIESLL
ncbi:MAG: glycosyltransferase family 4 protein [Candidatus Brocadiia bacterium]